MKAVLVNIFGGIMRCTTIANALVSAYKTVGFNVPLVVRLEGTEVDEGRKILADERREHHLRRRSDRRREKSGRRRDAANRVLSIAAPTRTFFRTIEFDMSILIDKNTRVICQGITGNVGQFHTKGCRNTARRWSAA